MIPASLSDGEGLLDYSRVTQKREGATKTITCGHAPLPRKRYLNETQSLPGRRSEGQRDKCELKRDPSHSHEPLVQNLCRLLNTLQKAPEATTEGTCICMHCIGLSKSHKFALVSIDVMQFARCPLISLDFLWFQLIYIDFHYFHQIILGSIDLM